MLLLPHSAASWLTVTSVKQSDASGIAKPYDHRPFDTVINYHPPPSHQTTPRQHMDMAQLMPMLLSFPPHPPSVTPLSDSQYDSGARYLVTQLVQVREEELLEIALGGKGVLDVSKHSNRSALLLTIVEMLDPVRNTIPYAIALAANLTAYSKTQGVQQQQAGSVLWPKLLAFCHNFDSIQARYVPEEYHQIVQGVVRIAQAGGQVSDRSRLVHTAANGQQLSASLAPISSAILRLDPTGSTLTSTHLLLVRSALKANAFAPAAVVLDKHVLQFLGTVTTPLLGYLCSEDLPSQAFVNVVQGNTSTLVYRDIMEYFLLRGTIYIGLGLWGKAFESLENVVTYPSKDHGVSKIMVEAYKKWVLVGVLYEGVPPKLPATASTHASKTYHVLGKGYDTLATLFETASADRLRAEAQVGFTTWQEDGNLGLVETFLAAYQQWQIRRLAKIYSVISISEVTQITTSAQSGALQPSDDATLALVSGLIADGSLDATITRPVGSSGVLTYAGDGSGLTEHEVQQRLADAIHSIKSLGQHVKHTDRRLTGNKEYVQWAQKQQQLVKSGLGVAHEEDVAMTIGGSGDIDDEDLMS